MIAVVVHSESPQKKNHKIHTLLHDHHWSRLHDYPVWVVLSSMLGRQKEHGSLSLLLEQIIDISDHEDSKVVGVDRRRESDLEIWVRLIGEEIEQYKDANEIMVDFW